MSPPELLAQRYASDALKQAAVTIERAAPIVHTALQNERGRTLRVGAWPTNLSMLHICCRLRELATFSRRVKSDSAR